MKGVLYISYDGMLEPLGQSQVLAYLKSLALDRTIHLISFEKENDWTNVSERHRIAGQLAAVGVAWHPLRYHKTPTAVATAWDLARGTALALWLVRRHALGIVHARSYVPAVIALAVQRQTRVKFLFDMRGFWADERLDGGLWSRSGAMYRVAKGFERLFLLSADHVVSLTHAAVKEMEKFPYLEGRTLPVTVIPTCADLQRFKPAPRTSDPTTGFVLGYVGSVGTWYLFDEVVACFAQLVQLRPDARFLIVNRREQDYIRSRLKAASIPDHLIEIIEVNHSDMPQKIAQMNAGIFFIKPVFSKQASAPTKLGEFLGCGIPCLGNAGVGDMQQVLEGERVGVTVHSFDDKALALGLQELLQLAAAPDITSRCVAAAKKHFSLDEGVARYRKIYESFDR